MKRNDFLRLCGILGIGLPFHQVLSSCKDDPSEPFEGSALIIGAGAAGMSAGYLLKQYGISFQILEASDNYGGRIKRTSDFVDFPIPLGGEWIHVERGILDEIVNDASVNVETQTLAYPSSSSYGWWSNGELETSTIRNGEDLKFIDSTWLDFFDRYVVPSISDSINTNTIVSSIDYSSDQITVTDSTGETYTADKVILTVPVKMLQNRTISFTPELPSDKLEAIDDVYVWPGIKVFIEFSEVFYLDFTDFDIQPTETGQKLYYDASYGQDSSRNVLGLFAVGTPAEELASLTDQARIAFILNELDTIYNNQATPNYIKHISQNWVEEPFIHGAYVNDHENWRKVRTLSEPISNKLYFAGEAYTDGEDWGSVHTAARSAKSAVDRLIRT